MTTDTGAARGTNNVVTATTETGGQTPDQGQMETEEAHTKTPITMKTGLILTMAGIILIVIGTGKIRDQEVENTNLTTTIAARATTGRAVERTTGRETIVATDRMVTQVTAKHVVIITMTDLGQGKEMAVKSGKVEAETGQGKGAPPQEARNH